MNEWEKETARIIKAVTEVKADNDKEKMIKLAVLMYMYKSLKDEETFNNNCEILDNISYEEMRRRRFV